MSGAIKDRILEIGLILDMQSRRIRNLEIRLAELDSHHTVPQPLPDLRDPDEPWLQPEEP